MEKNKEVSKLFKLLRTIKDLVLYPFRKMVSFFKNKKANSKRVKSTFVNFYNHIDMLLSLKIDFKAVYSDENEKIELIYAKSKKSKGEAENEK